MICSRLSADMSRDEDADFPLPPAVVVAGTKAGGEGPDGDVELPFPPLFPREEDPAEEEEEEEEEDFMAAAAVARLERFWNADGNGFCGCATELSGFSGFGLLKFAASPASPMGLFGPAEEDRAGALSSERLKGCDVSGGGVSGLLGGVSSRGTPKGILDAGLGGLMVIFFMFFVHRAQYQTRRGSLTS